MSHSNHNYAVIVAGGSGVRLWPMSRQQYPKQFQPILSDVSLFKGMYDLLAEVLPVENIFIQVNESLVSHVKEQIPTGSEAALIIEPMGRDTGPAYLFAAATLANRDPEAKVAIFWSDHIIQNKENFYKSLETVYVTLQDFPDRIVCLGVKPTYPHTGLGYIKINGMERNYPTGGVYAVDRFVEKPDYEKAQTYVASWQYLWNTGYSAFSVAHFGNILASANPEVAQAYTRMKTLLSQRDDKGLLSLFSDLPRISIDYWLMEKLSTLLVVPADLDWSDVGDWKTVHDLLSVAEATDVVSKGKHLSVNCHNCLVIGKDRLIATVGLDNIILIDAGDVVFAVHKDHAQEVKQLITQLKESEHSQLL